MTDILRVATRESQLAVWQADFVIKRIQAVFPNITCEKIFIKTSGDKFLEQPLYEIGGKALFLKELEEALLENRADIAVHSMKDVPADIPDGLGIGAVMERNNPLDAFISDKFPSFYDLPPQSKIGTASLRRKAQLQLIRSDLNYQPLRGNINTRLNKAYSGEYDAIILAACGLERLGMGGHIRHCFNSEECIPAVAQGVIGIEYAKNQTELTEILHAVNCEKTFTQVKLERIFQTVVGGNCKIPAACFIKEEAGGYKFHAFLADQSLTSHVKHIEHIQALKINEKVEALSQAVQDQLNRQLKS